MILVQKPQPAFSSPISMSFSHRRQSSAPVVVVQPTRIPGLLSLSKPPRSSPPRNQQRYNSKNAPKQALSASATPPTVVRAHAQPLTPAAQIYTASAAAATPSSLSRGRAQESHSKDKNLRNKRSPSPSSLRASGSGKHNRRQPSPPILPTMTPSHKQKPSQAEVPINSANHFDLFVDHSISTPTPSPRKSTHQSQSKPIPVTTSFTNNTPTLARSEPLPILLSNRRHQKQRPGPISKRALAIREFPICDDMSEIADDVEPTTPIARRLYKGAPLQSAPISAAPLEFFSPPSPKKIGDFSRNRKHRRTPSEGGVFYMSSDEEVSSGPGGMVLNGNLNPNAKAFGPLKSPASKNKEMNTTTPPRAVAGIRPSLVDGTPMTMSTSADKAAFFASSIFQNSPSPEELPDPLLL